jgi:flagellar export protein FliJ
MKAFRFSLQSVRVIRERKEQLAQKVYADALREHDAAADQLQRASDELARSWDALCRELSSGVNISEIRRARAWCNALETRQKERAADMQQAKYTLAAATRELMNAARDRQAMDNLHAKRRKAYDRDAQREEQKQLDEIGLRAASAALFGLSTANGM